MNLNDCSFFPDSQREDYRCLNFDLFSLVNHYFLQTTSSFLGAAGIFLTYLIPVYALAGFSSSDILFTEIGNVLHFLKRGISFRH